MDILELLKVLVILLAVLCLIEYLRYENAYANAWWSKKLTKEMRAAASWADCNKMVRVYRPEVQDGARN